MKDKIINFIKKYKWLILISILFLGVMIYCTLNTTLASDDYPYSLYYRGGARITEPSQVIANQLSDYKYINGRVVTNGIGQYLLMFDRPVFAILNSIVLLISLLLSLQLVTQIRPITVKQKSILLLLFIGLFLGFDQVKYLVYWVMGSTNYIWMLPLLLGYLCYYFKYGLFHKPILETIYIALVASFHESLLVFYIIFIISNMVYDKLNHKKLDKLYIYYWIGIILAGSFIFLSPGNQLRNNTWYPEWNKLNWIERLMMTIPVVGKTMFGFQLQHNIVPFIFLVVQLISIFMLKEKGSKRLGCLLLVTYFITVFTGEGWLYFIYSGLLFLTEAYLHYKNNHPKLILVSLSFYAIVYSMIITPEYAAGRPNYFMYFYMSIMITFMIVPWLENKKMEMIFFIIAILFSGFYSTRELMIYYEMGQIINDRKQAIFDVQTKKEEVLYFKSIPKHLRMYHMEPNTPADKNYWAHRYFCTYYQIPKDTEIRLVE